MEELYVECIDCGEDVLLRDAVLVDILDGKSYYACQECVFEDNVVGYDEDDEDDEDDEY